MLRAIELSRISVKTKGGPFGCVIVKNNQIIAEGSNEVTKTNDPTAHAEIVTIRNACNELKTFKYWQEYFNLWKGHPYKINNPI